MSEAQWDHIANEIQNLIADARYKDLRPMLEGLEHKVGLAMGSPEHPDALSLADAREMLNKINIGQSQIASGAKASASEVADQILQEITQGQPLTVENLTIAAAGSRAATRDYTEIKDARINIITMAQERIASNSVTIPVVLLVMNQTQARQCVSGVAFNGDKEAEQEFRALENLLLGKKFDEEWVQNYGVNAQEWKPFTSNNSKTIAETIAASFEDLQYHSKYTAQIVPEFINVSDFYAADSDRENRKLHSRLKTLREKGCIVIMDTISMRHPAIQSSYRRSWLDAFPNTIVARIAPNSQISELSLRAKITLDEKLDFDFHRRLQYGLDDYKCVNVMAESEFEKLIVGQARAILPAINERRRCNDYVGGVRY